MKKDTMCDFCSKNKAVITIPNPNHTGKNWWDVCNYCDGIIKEKQEQYFKELLAHHKERRDSQLKDDKDSKNVVK